MYKAINMDRVDFVEAFIDHGLVLSKFITYRVMLKLYNDVMILDFKKLFWLKLIRICFLKDSLKQTAFHSCLKRDRRLKQYSLVSYFQRKIAKNSWENQSDVVYGLKDVGRVINKLIDGFYRHRYYSWPFNKIPDEKYKKILKQTVNLKPFLTGF